MLARSEAQPAIQFTTPSSTPVPAQPWRAPGLLTARISVANDPLGAVTLVAEMDAMTFRRLRQEALALRARHDPPVVIELRYVDDPGATTLIATLDDLAVRGIRVIAAPVRSGVAEQTAPSPLPAPSKAAAPDSPDSTVDSFGLDREYRAAWGPAMRFLFERYWRVEVSGIEHVPATGPALVVANHSGAGPADAFMLAVALDLRHPARRCLRVLYDKFVDVLPWLGPIYNRLGGVASSFANAETLLRRGEVVGLFPEGIAGVEKRFSERYRLRPFRTGTARLSIRTDSPVVPVAIVGAGEAYPVIARLYRAGRLVGLPWIPVTPLFPLCGLAGALPLPTKWHMRFCAPIHPPAPDGRPNEEMASDLTARVRTAIEVALRELLAERRGIFT